MDTERYKHEYAKALRAWHLAWSEREEWHRSTFQPPDAAEARLVYDEVLKRHEWLRELEERAYDRFLAARAVCAQVLASGDT